MQVRGTFGMPGTAQWLLGNDCQSQGNCVVNGLRVLHGIRSRVPKPFRQRLSFVASYPSIYTRLWQNYGYDLRRFLRYSSVSGQLGHGVSLRAWIDADVHKIEKALALKAPRPGFGKVVVQRLLTNLQAYVDHNQPDSTVELSLNTLRAYLAFQRSHGHVDHELDAEIDAFMVRVSAPRAVEWAGTVELTREAVLESSHIDFERFVCSRHSIRQFSDDEVDLHLIEQAVRIAQRSPSVCNRQAARVYAFSDPEDRARVLACQQGNSGFGDQVKVVLVVAVDLQTFFSVGERNQAWIDGGMFAMSLVYGLHSVGLGACCLNWATEKARDKHLHAVARIPESDVILMQIGVGHLPPKLSVARSQRKPLHEVLITGSRTRALPIPAGE